MWIDNVSGSFCNEYRDFSEHNFMHYISCIFFRVYAKSNLENIICTLCILNYARQK